MDRLRQATPRIEKCFPSSVAAEAKSASAKRIVKGMQFAGREIRLLITSKVVYNPSLTIRITAW